MPSIRAHTAQPLFFFPEKETHADIAASGLEPVLARTASMRWTTPFSTASDGKSELKSIREDLKTH